jgi:hypothetical protein
MSRAFAARVWLGGAGLIAGLAGMALAQHWLVYAAVALLAGAVVVRLAVRRLARDS